MRCFVSMIVLSVVSVAHASPPITDIAFSPDGEQVVAVSQRGLTTYSWPTLEQLESTRIPIHYPSQLYFSNSNTKLVVAGGAPSETGQLVVTKWPNEQKSEANVVSLKGDVWFASVAVDDDYIVASTKGALSRIDRKTQVTRRFQGHSRHVLCLAKDEYTLFSGGDDTSIRVWNIDSGQLIRTLNHHTAAVRDLAVRPGDEGPHTLASAGADKTVRIWQPSIGRLVRFARLESAPLAIEWTPDGDLLLAACEDGCLRVIDPATVKIVQTHKAIEGWAYALAVSPDGQSAVIAGEGGQLNSVAIGREFRN